MIINDFSLSHIDKVEEKSGPIVKPQTWTQVVMSCSIYRCFHNIFFFKKRTFSSAATLFIIIIIIIIIILIIINMLQQFPATCYSKSYSFFGWTASLMDPNSKHPPFIKHNYKDWWVHLSSVISSCWSVCVCDGVWQWDTVQEKKPFRCSLVSSLKHVIHFSLHTIKWSFSFLWGLFVCLSDAFVKVWCLWDHVRSKRAAEARCAVKWILVRG